MQKLILFLHCLLLSVIANSQAQTITDTLDMAYSFFDKKDYKTSANNFDFFLSQVNGTKEDFYLAGVCHAQLNNKSRALEYINKAARNKADYYMVLNDPQLKFIHEEISELVEKIEEFDKIYSEYRTADNSLRRNKLLYLTDSIYHLLPAHKIPEEKLISLAYDFAYKDTFLFYYYMDAALFSSKNSQKVEHEGNILKQRIEKQVKQLNISQLDSLCKLNSFAYYYTISKYETKNTKGYSAPKIPFSEYLKLTTQKEYIAVVRGMINRKYDRFVFKLLYEGLANGKLNLEEVFKIRDIDSFFNQPVGKSFLTLLLSEQVIPAIENADRIVVSSSYEYLSSQREYHNYLKMRNFNSYLPSCKRYLIKNNIYDINKYSNKDIVIVENLPFRNEDEFMFIIDTNGTVKKAPKDMFKFFEPRDEVVLIKSAGNKEYGNVATVYYKHSVENIPFILSIKNGKFKKSIILSIRKKYFAPLISYAIQYFMEGNIRKDDVLYVINNYGYENLESFMVDYTKSVKKEQLRGFLQFIDIMNIAHTTVLDFLIQTLGNFEHYADKENRKLTDDIFNLLNEIAEDYIKRLDGRTDIVEPFSKNRRLDDCTKKDWDKASKLLLSWWDDYKKANPFKLPKLIDCKVTGIEDIPEDYSGIFLNNTNEPIFYNARENEIYKKSKKEKKDITDEELTIMVEDTETTVSDYRKSKLEGEIIGNAGYLFTPVQKDKPDELLVIQGLTETELAGLKEIYSKLGLERDGHNYFGNYEKSFDRFYPFRFNNRMVIFWFNQTKLNAAYLDNEAQISKQSIIVHQSREKTCSNKDESYKEIPQNLNSLKYKVIDDKLLIMCNFETKAEPECKSKSDSKIYLKLLDNNLKTIHEQSLPVTDSVNFKDNPHTEIITAGDFIYVFIQVDNDFRPLYCAVFDKKLEPVLPLFKVNKDEDKVHREYTLLKNKDEVYVVYPVNRNNDKLLVTTKITPHGKSLAPSYICLFDGYISSIKGEINKKQCTLYVSEKAFKTDLFKKLDFPLSKIDK